MGSLLKPWRTNITVGSVVLITAVYFISARTGQLFSIDPGNVSPIWLPSGIMLALALKMGPRIWPGIFLGAFLGNIWAYFSLASISEFLCALASATLNGIGDVLSTVVAAQLIVHFSKTNQVLQSTRSLNFFLLLGVLLGPLISALFGTGGLWLFNQITTEDVRLVFITWWLGDGVGVLVLTPFLLSWIFPERYFDWRTVISIVISILYSALTMSLLFGLITLRYPFSLLLFLLVPVQFVLLFRYGQRLVFSVQLSVLAVAIVATALSLGPFGDEDLWLSLIHLQGFAAGFSLILFFIAVLNLEKTRNEEYLEKRASELEELYRKDALTGLWNRYRIKEFLDIELNRFRREERPFGVLLLDIDDFKTINDTYGHLEGDQVLTEMSQLIQSHVREIDFLGRWGGEEFIIIVSNATESSLNILGAKLNTLIADHIFCNRQTITVSIGMALVRNQDTELSLLDRTDAGLYHAKEAGKNQAYIQTS